MTSVIPSDKEKLLNAVCEHILNRLPKEEGALCAEFARAFFSNIPSDDLHAWTEEDLYGAALNFWSLMQKNVNDETKIKIYNPDFEKHGWQSTHTVVEVLTKDMPFLVESVRMAINRMGMGLHLVVHMGGVRVVRNAHGDISEIVCKNNPKNSNYVIEAPMFFLVTRQTDHVIIENLHDEIRRVLHDCQLVVHDWMPMREQLVKDIEDLQHYPEQCSREDIKETQEFLKWIENHHFTIMGYCDYDLSKNNKGEFVINPVKGSGLGILSEGRPEAHSINISQLSEEAQHIAFSHQILILAKTEFKSIIHRDSFIDYIGIKRFNEQGEVIGEHRLYGLFTSAAYFTYIRDIPLLRYKVQRILKQSQLDPRSHGGRELINILETMPRDDLIQGRESELLDIIQGIRQLQDRKRIRLFTRRDVYNRFISCMVFVPKEVYNSNYRTEIERICHENLPVSSIVFSTIFAESVLARIHFMIHLKEGSELPSESKLMEVERQLVEAGRTWSDDLMSYLVEYYGEEIGTQFFNRYHSSFSPAYTSYFSPRIAVFDIKYLEMLRATEHMQLNLYKPLDEEEGYFRLKLYQTENTIPLSDVLPIIENLGLRALSERPFSLKDDAHHSENWINEFSIHYPGNNVLDLDEVREDFLQAFSHIWSGAVENDGFNRLVLAAGLNCRQVVMLRAYAKYFKQLGITYSQDYIETALIHQVAITRKLANLFEYRFSPDIQNNRNELVKGLREELLQDLEQVSNLDEDRIIRLYIDIILNTLRTNFYQKQETGEFKSYVSFKFDSKNVPGMPKPYPKYEIFVYSPRFEAIHLRCGDVARGGLRWSDRKEDFRTEVLGLMKAQQVKNSVIVPNGAKGGFVPKLLDHCANRDEVFAEGVACYQSFIRGLLDITDNLMKGEVVKPQEVICYDAPDPYLVVAADKGTATFSDYANSISLEYKFWLGDAFASGGSNGYDHKKMGITAKGAWESVKRHFYYLGKDIQTTPFTVVGVGDLSGDVFGNGMLLSKYIQLVAAFNHQHIFIDPNPEISVSYAERQRMFALPRSSWTDYNPELISKGGGVFNRSAKFINITEEMKQRFAIKEDKMEPNDLIKAILKAPFELLWSAGIGTFVKSSQESNINVGDRTNDAIRVNACDLHCQVVGEGGNLGFTQKARIEYALHGGRIYTDFIDNSGGVSCSDKEVNIKILLDILVKGGDLTLKQREQLLLNMTNDVSKLVLTENEQQTKAISLWATQASSQIDIHIRYLRSLEKAGKIDRAIEFLPSEQELLERKQKNMGLTIPEMAVLYCYSKIILKEAILASNVPEDPYFIDTLVGYFPTQLTKPYHQSMQDHPLKREIIATKLSNLIVNEMGFTFVHRMYDETGAPVSAIVSAFMIARSIMKMDDVWQSLQSMQLTVDASFMTTILMLYVRLLRRLTRWLLRSERRRLDIKSTINKYQGPLHSFMLTLQDGFNTRFTHYFDNQLKNYKSKGLSESQAQSITHLYGLFAVLDILQIAEYKLVPVETAAAAFFAVGDHLDLEYIRYQIIQHESNDHWEALAREAVRDELDAQQRQLTESVLQEKDTIEQFNKRLKDWSSEHRSLIERWNQLLKYFRGSGNISYTMFYVAMRELLDLTQTALQNSDGDSSEFF
jgi:glutamate dehydrogenase